MKTSSMFLGVSAILTLYSMGDIPKINIFNNKGAGRRTKKKVKGKPFGNSKINRK